MKRLSVWIEDDRLAFAWRTTEDLERILESLKAMFEPGSERRYDPELRKWSVPRRCEKARASVPARLIWQATYSREARPSESRGGPRSAAQIPVRVRHRYF